MPQVDILENIIPVNATANPVAMMEKSKIIKYLND